VINESVIIFDWLWRVQSDQFAVSAIPFDRLLSFTCKPSACYTYVCSCSLNVCCMLWSNRDVSKQYKKIKSTDFLVFVTEVVLHSIETPLWKTKLELPWVVHSYTADRPRWIFHLTILHIPRNHRSLQYEFRLIQESIVALNFTGRKGLTEQKRGRCVA
jgi:hypothetical protein